MKARLLILVIFTFLSLRVHSQNSWTLLEETVIKGTVSGTISQGYVFKVKSNDFYVVNDATNQKISTTTNPAVNIFQSGSLYQFEIQNLDAPIICTKLKGVIESKIEGEFKGWDGETIFNLSNKQTWQQSSPAVLKHQAKGPKVLIYEFKGAWMMRVENVEEVIEVKKLTQGKE